MLRPPLATCYKHPLRTGSTVFAVAFCIFFPCLVALAIIVGKDSMLNYFATYEPIVYLDLDASDQDQDKLVAELEALGDIKKVEERSRETAYDDLLAELEVGSHKTLGLDANIFPKSLKIMLKVPSLDYSTTFDYLSNLRDRDEVLDVDVPNATALRVLNSTTYVLILTLIFALLSAIVGYVLLHVRLRDLLSEELEENRLLYTFGAQPDALRQPTIVRGLVLGIVSGLIILVLFGAILAIWYANAPMFVGKMMLSAWTWPLVLSPVLASTVIGFIAGLAVSRSAIGSPAEYEIVVVKK